MRFRLVLCLFMVFFLTSCYRLSDEAQVVEINVYGVHPATFMVDYGWPYMDMKSNVSIQVVEELDGEVDLFYLNSVKSLASMVEAGQVKELSLLLNKASQIHPGQWVNGLAQTVVDTLGGIYGVPSHFNFPLMVVNTSLLQQMGVQPPKLFESWEQILLLARDSFSRISQEELIPLTLSWQPPSPFHALIFILRYEGYQFLSENKNWIDTGRWQTLWDDLIKTAKLGALYSPRQLETEQLANPPAFNHGNVMIELSDAVRMLNYVRSNLSFEWISLRLPSSGANNSPIYELSGFWSVGANTELVEETLEFLEWMITVQQFNLSKSMRGLPIINTGSMPIDYDSLNITMMVEHPISYWDEREWEAFVQEVTPTVNQALDGSISSQVSWSMMMELLEK